MHGQDGYLAAKDSILPCNLSLRFKIGDPAIEIALENYYCTWGSREESFADRYFIVTGNVSSCLYAEPAYFTE